MLIWNPWHGCRKLSEGCRHCYVYRRDAQFGRDSRVVEKTAKFGLPLKRNRRGGYVLSGGTVYTCMTSDFFIGEADPWREEAWRMIRERTDLHFFIVTKRIDRFTVGLPGDWENGYENVTICLTCEDQKSADYRLPIFLELPLKHRHVIHEPMLEAVRIEPYLASGKIRRVICGGESGPEGRLCDFSWVLDSRAQCARHGVDFFFKQTGTHFRKDGRIYRVPRMYQISQAVRAGINLDGRNGRVFPVLGFGG